MAFAGRSVVIGSLKAPLPGAIPAGAVEADQPVTVTVYLRRKGSELKILSGNTPRFLSHHEFSAQQGADPTDIGLVENFAHDYQLTVVESSLPKRRVILSGTAESMSKAFGTELSCYKLGDSGHEFRGRTGDLTVPTKLVEVVIAVLGLDNRPVAKPHLRRKKHAAVAISFTPPQVAALYDYPKGLTGKGQTVAIIELGGGYAPADLTTYFSGLGITSPPTVTAVAVDGGMNTPGGDADGEVMLDIEIVGSIATGANIPVYFAPNTDQGFIDAITDAVHDTTRKPSVISISWGGPEDSWTQQSQTAMNASLQDAATLGVTVTVAAGDNGSSDGATDGKLHVDFPASSPYVLACGGTTLAGSGTSISSEVVWNETANQEGATGGGVSTIFPIPAYQSGAGVPVQPQTNFAGRGVPDVSGDADPASGYQIRVDGQNQVVGGTSAVAPLWAALIALFNEKLGKPVGFINPALYKLNPSAFHDIQSGNNDDSGLGYFQAKAGWDACTGLGTPDGAAILNALPAMSGTTSTTASGTSNPTSSSPGGERTEVPGSDPKHSGTEQWSDLQGAGTDQVTVTVVLRRKSTDIGEGLLSGQAPHATHEQVSAALGANPADMEHAREFASHYGLTVIEEDPAARTLKLSGTAHQISQAFGVKLGLVCDARGDQYMSHQGCISVPASLAGKVMSVLGLDQRPVARSHSSAS